METILTVKEESMIAVADAVREKSGTSGALSFPSGMVDAINSIETTTVDINVDNQTIINDGGVIRTAIGGSITTYPQLNQFYSASDYGLQTIYSEDGKFYFPGFNILEYYNMNGNAKVQIEIQEYPEGIDNWSQVSVLKGLLVDRQILIEENNSIFCGNIVNYEADGRTYIEHRASEEYPNAVITNIWMNTENEIEACNPIRADFIPVDGSTIQISDGRLSAVAAGGGSANIDNLTIIEENGVLRTAIGGYRTEAIPGYTCYETNENVNATFDIYSSEQIFEMSGYFTLPNWTTIGASDRTMRATWEEHPYLDAPDWITTAFADVFWLDDTYRTLMVDNIQGSELIHSASIDNETGYFGGLAPHIYEDPNSWSHIFISNFRIEVPESEAGYSTIDAGFINFDTGTLSNESGVLSAHPVLDVVNTRFDDIYAQIDDIRNGSGGSSISADGLTIIDDGGTIRTAIGGYFSEGVEGGIHYQYGNTLAYSSDGIQLPNWSPLGDEWLEKTFRIKYFASYEYWEESMEEWITTDMEEYDSENCYYDGTYIWLDGRPEWMDGTIHNDDGIMNINPDVEDRFTGRYIYEFTIYSPKQPGYVPIDANFIPVDGDTIQIADGRLVAAGVSEDRVNELINEALGVIENGTY